MVSVPTVFTLEIKMIQSRVPLPIATSCLKFILPALSRAAKVRGIQCQGRRGLREEREGEVDAHFGGG